MVMMLFKVINIHMPVNEAKIDTVLKDLEKRFGDRLDISIQDGEIVIEGDELRDYRLHDQVLDLLEEEVWEESTEP